MQEGAGRQPTVCIALAPFPPVLQDHSHLPLVLSSLFVCLMFLFFRVRACSRGWRASAVCRRREEWRFALRGRCSPPKPRRAVRAPLKRQFALAGGVPAAGTRQRPPARLCQPPPLAEAAGSSSCGQHRSSWSVCFSCY